MEERDVWLEAWRALLGTLDQRGLLRWEETFLDGSFAPAKKGALRSGNPNAARARKGTDMPREAATIDWAGAAACKIIAW